MEIPNPAQLNQAAKRRHGTGSVSDLVSLQSAIDQAAGRLRSPYRAALCLKVCLPFVCLLAILTLLFSAKIANAQATPQNRFEKNVEAYETADKTTPPPKGAILLVGDSQFYRWETLNEDLPEYTIINRGIDSFQFSDILFFFDRIVPPYKPRMIVLHIGGNDVHNGKTAEQVLADFKTFVARVRAVQANVPIAFSSITPGPGRWDEADRRKRTNQLLKEYIATQKNLHFIDLWDAMLTPDGKPREDLWVEDRIHPNHAGYLVRVRIMRPLLGKPEKRAQSELGAAMTIKQATDFDIEALYSALDAQRRSRGLSWRQVANEISGQFKNSEARPIGPSTLTGMRERVSIEGDGVLQMLLWLRRTPESFIPGGEKVAEGKAALPQLAPHLILRFDAKAIYEGLNARKIERGITWEQVANEIGGLNATDLTRLAKGGRVGFPQVMRIVRWLGRPAANFTRASER